LVGALALGAELKDDFLGAALGFELNQPPLLEDFLERTYDLLDDLLDDRLRLLKLDRDFASAESMEMVRQSPMGLDKSKPGVPIVKANMAKRANVKMIERFMVSPP